MSRLRYKVAEPDDNSFMLRTGDLGTIVNVKLQQCVCVDTSNNHTYWQWQDLEVVPSDTEDGEVQERW